MSIRIEKNCGVWTVIHSRPEVKNAMDPESAQALFDAFEEFDQTKEALVAVFWGEGGAFCSGFDLKIASDLSESHQIDRYDFPKNNDEPSLAIMGPSRLELSKPVIAAVAGPAVAGGMELAIWADLRVMEESAYMGVYCRRWGVPLIDGGTVRLPRLVGEGRAMDLILTGRRIDAVEALQIGLCEYVVPDGQARDKAEQLAHSLTRFPQSCMNSDRKSVRQQHGLSERAALQQEWRISKDEVIKCGIHGAKRFAQGKGRGGDYDDI